MQGFKVSVFYTIPQESQKSFIGVSDLGTCHLCCAEKAKEDRIVFDGCETSCGLVSHKGEEGNRWHECELVTIRHLR